jgi:cysteine synthase A/cysteine synthase B
MDHASRVYDDITELLPNEENPSPMVRLNRLVPPGSTLWAKLEWLNPFGSVKDRAAWSMIQDLERRDELGPSRPGRGIVEPTSGNTGLSLAALAGLRGYPMLAVVPSKVPEEKKLLLRVFGAKLEVVADALCPLPGSEDGTIGLARTPPWASADRYVMPNQYENPHNVEAHLRTTGPEIMAADRRQGDPRLHLLLGPAARSPAGQGAQGPNPAVKIVAVQPSAGHDVPGIRNVSELDVSKLFDPSLVDEILEIDHYELAYRTRPFARHEGIPGRPELGPDLEGARRVAQREKVSAG